MITENKKVLFENHEILIKKVWQMDSFGVKKAASEAVKVIFKKANCQMSLPAIDSDDFVKLMNACKIMKGVAPEEQLAEDRKKIEDEIAQNIYCLWGVDDKGSIMQGGRMDIILKAHKERIEKELKKEFQPENDEIAFSITEIDRIPDALSLAFIEAQEKFLKTHDQSYPERAYISVGSFKAGMLALVDKQRDIDSKRTIQRLIVLIIRKALESSCIEELKPLIKNKKIFNQLLDGIGWTLYEQAKEEGKSND